MPHPEHQTPPRYREFEGYATGAGDPVLTLVEYGDFECPHCTQAFPAVKQLVGAHADMVRFVFRHFPQAEIHRGAILAAEAAEASGSQGKFWEFHDLLFKRKSAIDEGLVLGFAKELDLDLAKFMDDLGLHRHLPRVVEHIDSGRMLGIRGTPAFLLNGKLVDVSYGLEPLRVAVRTATGSGGAP